MKRLTANFQVLKYEYMNTGGNTMVGVFTVWLPKEKRTVYALTNEEGCTLSVVDYISNELEIYDYEELWIDTCDFGRLTGCEKYYELYRYCLNEYTKSDCRYFGITRNIPYSLLSDEVRAMITPEYLAWLDNNGYDVETDGEVIIVHPDYDECLEAVKRFKKYNRKSLPNLGELELVHNGEYTLTLGTETIRIPFNADTFTAVDNLLTTVIHEW